MKRCFTTADYLLRAQITFCTTFHECKIQDALAVTWMSTYIFYWNVHDTTNKENSYYVIYSHWTRPFSLRKNLGPWPTYALRAGPIGTEQISKKE